MARKLDKLREVIMLNNHTREEWLRIEQEVAAAMKESTEEEIDDFVESGAGEILDMICEGYRYQ